jgi:hypothetical protein
MTVYGVDAEKIAECNRFTMSVTLGLGLQKTDVYEVVRQAFAKTGCIYDAMPENVKQLLNDNHDKLSYLIENENHFIQAASDLIPIVARQIGAQHVTDEMESCAMLSIRRSFYYYDDTKCNLKRFCYAGIGQELKQTFRKGNFKKNKVWRSRIHLDQHNAETLAPNLHTTEVAEDESSLLDQPCMAGLSGLEIINKVADHAKLAPQDKKLFEVMLRNGGNRNWVSEYLKETGLSITKQGVYYKRDLLIKRLQQEVVNHGQDIFE